MRRVRHCGRGARAKRAAGRAVDGAASCVRTFVRLPSGSVGGRPGGSSVMRDLVDRVSGGPEMSVNVCTAMASGHGLCLGSPSALPPAQGDASGRTYDLIVIGAGSGNMVITPELAGLRFAIVEPDRFGGTCQQRRA